MRIEFPTVKPSWSHRRVASDEVDVELFRGPVQRLRDADRAFDRIAVTGTSQRRVEEITDRRNSNALIDNGDAELGFDGLRLGDEPPGGGL